VAAARRGGRDGEGLSMHIAIIIGKFPPGVMGGEEIQAQTWAKHAIA
jgi:hypothetical protein